MLRSGSAPVSRYLERGLTIERTPDSRLCKRTCGGSERSIVELGSCSCILLCSVLTIVEEQEDNVSSLIVSV